MGQGQSRFLKTGPSYTWYIRKFRYNEEYELIFGTRIRNAAGISYMRPAAFI